MKEIDIEKLIKQSKENDEIHAQMIDIILDLYEQLEEIKKAAILFIEIVKRKFK